MYDVIQSLVYGMFYRIFWVHADFVMMIWNSMEHSVGYISRRDDHFGRVVTQSEYRQYFDIIRESY